LNYLFEVKKNGITKAFVYGVGSVDEAVENTMASFNVDTGIATRYIPIINEEPWKEFIDPTLIFYDSLPIRFHYKTVYYSVAMIVVKLFGRNVAILSGTKLEAFIKRAKNSQIQKRIFSF
jgi:hypothetical protein